MEPGASQITGASIVGLDDVILAVTAPGRNLTSSLLAFLPALGGLDVSQRGSDPFERWETTDPRRLLYRSQDLGCLCEHQCRGMYVRQY